MSGPLDENASQDVERAARWRDAKTRREILAASAAVAVGSMFWKADRGLGQPAVPKSEAFDACLMMTVAADGSLAYFSGGGLPGLNNVGPVVEKSLGRRFEAAPWPANWRADRASSRGFPSLISDENREISIRPGSSIVLLVTYRGGRFATQMISIEDPHNDD